MAVPAYASSIERIWHDVFLVLCAAVFLFLIAPILAIVPLSFNSEPWFTYPLAGFSLRWYEDFFTSERWQTALFNSVVVWFAPPIPPTGLCTLPPPVPRPPRLPIPPFIMSILT